jgi:hypothetical protein
MSEISQDKLNNNDEIDLLDLFRRMGRTIRHWARVLGRAFLISAVFLLKRWLPLGLSLIVAVGISYILKTTSESLYTSDLVLRNNAISNAEMIAYINRLHNFCSEDNKSALESSLSIDADAARNIGDISAYWIIDKGKDGIPDEVDYSNNHNIYDTLNVRIQDRLDIRVKIKSPQKLTVLKNGILSFIKKDQLFEQRNEVRRRQNKELLATLDNDILLLDSLQKVKYFEETRNMLPKSGFGQMIFLQEPKTQLVYTDKYKLYERKQALESEIDLYPETVTVISDFNLPAKPDNGTLFYGAKIIPSFFGITLLLLIILANRKKLKEVYNKY